MNEAVSRREEMVERQIRSRGIHDERVLAAMVEIPRELFVPTEIRAAALEDRALPIGHGVTISQPYIVAYMSELAAITPGDRVLEIGTGSGYQAAVLAALGAEVYSIERIEVLYQRTRDLFAKPELAKQLHAERIHLRHGDGFGGWPEAAPFAAILLTAAPEQIPDALVEQLALGGRLVAPEGPRWLQSLIVIERREDRTRRSKVLDVAFVPMLPGRA